MLQVSPSQRTEGPRGRIAYPVGVVVIADMCLLSRTVPTVSSLDKRKFTI